MKISSELADVFDRYTKPKIRDWLLNGLVSWASGDSNDGFYPHSFPNLYERPAEGVEQLYSAASLKTKQALRSAIVSLAGPCRPESPDYSDLEPKQRMDLLKTFLRLTEYTLCFDAIDSIRSIACHDSEYWGKQGFHNEVFPACLGCIGHLAINHGNSMFWKKGYGPQLEESLVIFSNHTLFDPQFSPFVIYALVSVAPEHLLDHLALLGDRVSELHKRVPSQRKFAHLTAERIIQNAPLQLFRHFSELSFRFPNSRDRWLVEALFSTEGPLRQRPHGLNVTNPWVSLNEQPNKRISLKHEDWLFFGPPETLPLPGPDPAFPMSDTLSKAGNEISAFFGHSVNEDSESDTPAGALH